MSKPSATFAKEANQQDASRPQISDTPTITSSGALAWNVRDILFGPNRTDANSSERRPNLAKSTVKE
jgi:hypothetical protein